MAIATGTAMLIAAGVGAAGAVGSAKVSADGQKKAGSDAAGATDRANTNAQLAQAASRIGQPPPSEGRPA